MSDRVACLSGCGLDENYTGIPFPRAGLPHCVPGLDHFPFLLNGYPSAFELGLTAFPITLTLEQLCSAYYLVKKWHVYGSANRFLAPSFNQSYSWDFISTIGDDATLPNGESILTREAELVVPQQIYGTDVWGVDGGAVGFQLHGLPPLIRDGPLFKTYCVFTLFSDAIGVFISTAREGSRTLDAGLTASITINGTSFPLTFYKPSSDTSTITGTFTVEPDEYWPYATRAGLPVYNTSTGARLRDPFS